MLRTTTLFATLLLATPAYHAAQAQTAPLRADTELSRVNGEPVTVYVLKAGEERRESPFSFTIRYDGQGEELGKVVSVGWTVNFDDYCRDKHTWVQSILEGPEGQIWRGYMVGVPAGPDRTQYWSSGSTGARAPGAFPTPGLLEAMEQGGIFKVAYVNGEGGRWDLATIDTLDRERRAALINDLHARLEATQEASNKNDRGPIRVVQAPTVELSDPPRPCP